MMLLATGFTITSDQIIWFCSFAVGIWGVLKIIKELRKPSEDLKGVVKKHDTLLDNDNKRIREIEESNQMILKCLLVIINHEITGNGIDKMKVARDELQEFLINK